jgi:hypothetical protein
LKVVSLLQYDDRGCIITTRRSEENDDVYDEYDVYDDDDIGYNVDNVL